MQREATDIDYLSRVAMRQIFQSAYLREFTQEATATAILEAGQKNRRAKSNNSKNGGSEKELKLVCKMQ